MERNLEEAWKGEIVAGMDDLSDPENAWERERWSRLLEMFIPLRERGTDRIIAVAELYLPPRDILAQVGDAQRTTWIVVTLAIVASAVLLFGIVKQGSDTIKRQEVALTRQVGELTLLVDHNASLSERVRTAAERSTTLNERSLRRVSTDLHDGPGQMLSLALLRLDSMRIARPPGRPPGPDEVAEVEVVLREAMSDMRAIAAGLRVPELASMGARAIAERAVSDHERRSGAAVALTVRDDLPAAVSLPVKIALFRALQEALSNATRHGGGTSIRVTLGDGAGPTAAATAGSGGAGHPSAGRGPAPLEVSDEGTGFDPSDLSDDPGPRARRHPGAGRAPRRRLRPRSAPRRGDEAVGLVAGPGGGRAGVSDTIRVGVADDHPMFRAGVVAALSEVADIEVVGEAGDAPSAVDSPCASSPTSWCSTSPCPEADYAAAGRIGDACPATRIVMLTVSEDEDDILAAVKAGAAAYVLKGAGASELIDVIRAVHAGEVYVAPALAWGMLREMTAPRAGPYDDLTAREQEVLELVAEGLSNQEIGGAAGPRREDDQAPHDEHPRQAPRSQPRRGGVARRPRRPPARQRSLSVERGPLALPDLRPGDAVADGRLVIRRLGGGRRYEAWLGWDDHLAAPVVIKVLRAAHADDGRARTAIAREGAHLAHLAHPVLVRSFDADLDGPRPYLVLELLDGPRLSTLIRRYGPLSPEQLVPLAMGISSALSYLHNEEVVHLDVKPQNLIMGAPPRLIDLSLARRFRGRAEAPRPDRHRCVHGARAMPRGGSSPASGRRATSGASAPRSTRPRTRSGRTRSASPESRTPSSPRRPAPSIRVCRPCCARSSRVPAGRARRPPLARRPS